MTPEWLNAVPLFSLAHYRAWEREHRALDGEHASPAPQAAGTIRWVDDHYEVSDDAVNIAGIRYGGAGRIIVDLSINALSPDDWFPVAIPQGKTRARTFEWGPERGTNHCGIRILERKLSGPVEDEPYLNTSFRFEAYMKARAVGDSGVDNAPGAEPTKDVRLRICADGPESADHRNKLYRFCDWLRDAMVKCGHRVEGHEVGLHRFSGPPGNIPLGIFQMVYDGNRGRMGWKAGAVKDATSYDDDNRIAYSVDRGVIRCARWMPRLETVAIDRLEKQRAAERNDSERNQWEDSFPVGVGIASSLDEAFVVHSIGVVVFGE